MEEGCALCPRACGARRERTSGPCGAGASLRVARAAPHFGEEPCISGTRGSGTVFFAGCPLRCCFCQNYTISHGLAGVDILPARLAEICMELEAQGVHNLNLVTATQYRPTVQAALAQARALGFGLPVVWNTSGYETPGSIKALAADVDIWLSDLKFYSPALAGALCGARDYFAHASRAVKAMVQSTGPPKFDADGLLRRGVFLRVLVLPGQRQDAKALLRWMAEALPRGSFLLSLMRQYTPPTGRPLPAPYNRTLSSYEYRDVVDTALTLGLTQGFTQEAGCTAEGDTPDFDGTGVLAPFGKTR